MLEWKILHHASRTSSFYGSFFGGWNSTSPTAIAKSSRIYRYAAPNGITSDAMTCPLCLRMCWPDRMVRRFTENVPLQSVVMLDRKSLQSGSQTFQTKRRHYLLLMRTKSSKWTSSLTRYLCRRKVDASIIRPTSSTGQLVWYARRWPSNLVVSLSLNVANRHRRHTSLGKMCGSSWKRIGCRTSACQSIGNACETKLDGPKNWLRKGELGSA